MISRIGGNGEKLTGLRARLCKARAKGAGTSATERARRLLDAYLATAERHGRASGEVITDLASGGAAFTIGMAVRETLIADPPEAVRHAACAEGCAFCCILRGGDGGTITAAEAERLHGALAPLAGQADGRDWHPDACPALDPATRGCRAYEARPMICRSFLSTDAGACEVNANGGSAPGAGLIGTHLDYLAVNALARDALRGTARVATFSLARIAAGAVAGESLAQSLDAARHQSRALEDACRDAVRASKGTS
ncbi:YkgJ family cysteine cluster protein [Maritimibacter sp. HL-12]|jgi:Fe-S-cluster containining protein|uniref:YkgJ family cysteine cluster protein n=1 Tax=Maritimibacter sp. HL-12 TaxID=1162418 RepID=UPI000A0F02B8|nr:YkgJ family cysteine cluster protein [Maritimibacter sp. HL-12]SMH48544.1 Predicted Fe-S-cluster oxidoreductase [Maritimibacter sp. HL-12]